MKRGLIVILLIFAGWLTVPLDATSAEFSFNGYYHIVWLTGDNIADHNDDDNLDNTTFTWQTFIPTFTATLSEDFKGVITFRFSEMIYGDSLSSAEGYWFGTYTTWVPLPGQVRYSQKDFLNRSYMDVRLPGTPVRIMAGIQGPQTSKQLIIGGDNAWPGVKVYTNFPTWNGNLQWYKTRETFPRSITVTDTSGNDRGGIPDMTAWKAGIDEADDDITVWAGELNYTGAPNTTIGTYIYYLNSGGIDTTLWDGVSLTWWGFTGTKAMGQLTLTGDFIYQFGDYDTGQPDGVSQTAARTTGDINAWITDLRATYNAGAATVGGKLVWAKGDDDLTDNDHERYQAINSWYPGLTLWGGGKLAWVQNTSYTPWGDYSFMWERDSVNSGFANGVKLIQFWTSLKPTERLTLEPNIAFLWSDQSPYPIKPNDDTYMGTEVDLFANYKLFDGVYLNLEAGYAFTGDYFKYQDNDPDDPDNAWKIAGILNMSF